MYDDHEIFNDYDNGSQSIYYQESIRFWNYYLGNLNPKTMTKNGAYYSFEYGNIGFFVLDCRMFRSKNKMEDTPEKTMLGEEQKKNLLKWLKNSDKEKKNI